MEVYGTKPKRFTKEWWEYFWDYYKLHTIVTGFALIVIISSAVECAHRVNYDLQADIITETAVSQDSIDKFIALMQDNIDDATGNGKKEAYVTYLDMRDSVDPQMVQAMQTKYMIEMGYTESFVFIVSGKYADSLIDAGAFEEATTWTNKAAYRGYCISLEGNKLLEDAGFDASTLEDLYVGVIRMRERDKKSEQEKNMPKHANGIRFAKYLVSKG